ncbi:MAG: radical SAM protein [Terracidiphilus sp.]
MLSSQNDPATPLAARTGQRVGRGYYVYVTEACNLRCSYCFVKDKHNGRHLTKSTANQILGFIAQDAESLSSVYVHFFGGEPLLRPTMIDYLSKGLRAWSSGRQTQLRLGVTTNGTLLTADNCEMLKQHDIGVQLSLDGSKEGNDVHRQFMGGTQCGLRAAGAFDRVNIENYIACFGKGAPNCRMTLTVQNLPYLEKSIAELYAQGFKSFSVIPDCDSGTWTVAHFKEYEQVMRSVLKFWIQYKDVWISSIDKTVQALLSKRRPKHLCQVGSGILGITVDGDLYPCHDFSGRYSCDPEARQKLLIGHVTTGYKNVEQHFGEMSIDPEVKSGCGYDCATCWAKWSCARGCPYMNYASTGDIRTVSPTYCATQRIDALLALKWMGTSDQINFSYAANARVRRGEGRTRQTTLTSTETTSVASTQTDATVPEAVTVN